METNWIIISVVLVFAVCLTVYLVIKDQKDKKEVTTSLDDETDTETESESEKDI